MSKLSKLRIKSFTFTSEDEKARISLSETPDRHGIRIAIQAKTENPESPNDYAELHLVLDYDQWQEILGMQDRGYGGDGLEVVPRPLAPVGTQVELVTPKVRADLGYEDLPTSGDGAEGERG